MTDAAATALATCQVHEIITSDRDFWEVFHYVWGQTKRSEVDYRDVLKPLIGAMQYWLERKGI